MPTEKKSKPPCELCKQPVELAGFSLKTPRGEVYFCCQGCLSIYQLIHPDKVLPKQ